MKGKRMLIYEYKVDGTRKQYAALDEAIRVVQFIRNKCLRLWMDERSISKNDLQVYEQLQIRNMVKNRHLAKSIHDSGWGTFISWVKAYGLMHNVPVIAVAPQFTSQECSACGAVVKKSLSVRTHICTRCGVVLDRDHNAARNILAKALACTLGHRETSGSPENASGQTASTPTPKRATSKRAG